MFDFIYHTQVCTELIAEAPVNLILYTHIPSMLVALILGLLVWAKTGTLLSKILFSIALSFSLWSLVDLVVWLSANNILTMLSWSFFGLLTGLISILTFYFFYVFISKKDLSLLQKFLIFLPLLPVVILTPTEWNVSHFDLVNCEAVDQINFVTYYYILGAAAAVGILIMALSGLRKADRTTRKEIVLMTAGLELFLGTFLSLGYIASYFDNYEIEFYGLFGMVIFIAFLAYLIVKFKAFNIKLLGTQALVWAQILLIGSQFLFVRNNTNRVLTAVTLVISAWLGLIIVRSVKKEVEARETIEGLAKKLESSNAELESANEKLTKLDQQKSEFVSIASHQLRSPLTVIKGYLSMFLEGEEALGNVKAGTITQKGVEVMDTMFQSTVRLAHIIEDFLNVSRIEQGRMKYEMSDFDIRVMTQDVVTEFKAAVAQRGLTINFTDKTPSESYMVNADSGKLRQVIGNVIDNSIKYTPQGGIIVYLERAKDSIRINIKDTGIGISPENLKNLFQKFARATNAGKVNVTGSGLGLFVAIEIMKAHGGKLWAESEGEGKGSTFVIELPLSRK